MAQAFEIPRGNRTAHDGRPATRQSAIAEPPATLPDRRSRADPAAGSATGIWAQLRLAASAEAGSRGALPARFPARQPAPRLIVSSRFDKGRPRARLAAIEDSRRFWRRSAFVAGFDPFLLEPVYHLFSPRASKWLHEPTNFGESHARDSHFRLASSSAAARLCQRRPRQYRGDLCHRRACRSSASSAPRSTIRAPTTPAPRCRQPWTPRR